MNIKLMRYLCLLSQPVLKKMISKFLRTKYKDVVETDAYIYAEGTLPICLVAHMDTVFKTLPEEIFYDSEQKVMWSPQGLGADDRAGIYAILDIINSGFLPSVVFTTDEELGCVGAAELVIDHPECPFENLKAIIELDRRGKEDSVFYECDNIDFEMFIAQFGFKPNLGSFSDISTIAPEWGVAAVNVSVGYEDEHSYHERLYLNHLALTIERVKNILRQSHTMKNYAYVPAMAVFEPKCMVCESPLYVNNCNQVEIRGVKINVCNDCLAKYYGGPEEN